MPTANGFRLFVLIAAIMLAFTPSWAQEQPSAEPAPPPPTPEEITPVAGIEFTGNTVLSRETLIDAVGIKPGQPLTAERISEAVRQIEQAYARGGYIAGVSSYEILAEPERTLIFHIQELTVADIRIEGLRRTREEVVRRLIETQPREVYSQFTVQRDVARLDNLGFFERIDVLLQDAEEPNQVIVIYQFEEARTQRVDLSGSYSPEGRLILQVQYSQTNLFGRAQQLRAAVNIGTIEGKLGGQIVYFNPFLGEPQMTLYARAFSDIVFRFGEDLLNAPGFERYFERRTGGQAVVSQSAGQAARLSYGLRYDNVGVENLPVDSLVPGFPSPDAQVLGSTVSYVRDRRDFIIIPVSGNYLSGTVEPAYIDFEEGGTDTVAKTSAEWRTYLPLRTVTPETLRSPEARPVPSVAVRLRAGTSLGDLPFFEQFFIGGIYNLRGYREGRFWGQNFFALNTELRWPLSRDLIGLAFIDVGDAWGSDYQFVPGAETDFRQHESFSPRAGAGIGAWYVSPFGIVRLEYAWGEEGRLHFTVGESF